MESKYRRMIRGMKPSTKREWSVYMLRCGDGSLYTGIAKDVALRLEQHRRGRGAAYTRTHLPVALVYQEARYSRSAALVREAQLKSLPRSRKEGLLATSS